MSMKSNAAANVTTPIDRRTYEGVCAVCYEDVALHIGKDGRYLGCPAGRARTPIKMILVPDRRTHAHRVFLERRQEQAARYEPVGLAKRPRTIYQALYPLSAQGVRDMASERDRFVYRCIAKAKLGLTANDVAGYLGLETTRGVVESSLQRLKARGFLSTTELA